MTTTRCVAALASALLMSAACSLTGTLERSLGRVILESDKYPYGAHMVPDAIDREYESVRALPVAQRVRFFWSVMMNVNLDASYSVEFAELIARDCPREFEVELVTFIERMERTPPAQEPETSIAKRMLTTLQLLRDKGCPRCKSEERSVETL